MWHQHSPWVLDDESPKRRTRPIADRPGCAARGCLGGEGSAVKARFGQRRVYFPGGDPPRILFYAGDRWPLEVTGRPGNPRAHGRIVQPLPLAPSRPIGISGL